MTHTELQAQFVKLAKLLGWRVLTVRKSIGRGHSWMTTTSIVGWPDCLLFSTRQPGRHVAVELKVATGVEPDQQRTLDELEAAGFEVYVWTASDLEDAARILARPR